MSAIHTGCQQLCRKHMNQALRSILMIGVQIKILHGFGLSKPQLRGTYPPPTHPQSHGSGIILHCWLLGWLNQLLNDERALELLDELIWEPH